MSPEERLRLKSKSKEELIDMIASLEVKLRDAREALELKIEEYMKQYELNKLSRSKEFDTKSEKTTAIVNDVETVIEKEASTKTPRKKYKTRIEKILKELKNVIQETIVIDFDFEKNNVDRSKVKLFKTEESIKLEVNSTPFKIVTVQKLIYKDKEHFYQAPNNDIFPNSILTPSFAAQLLVYRYLLQVPLYRYSQYLYSIGIPISEENLSHYISKISDILKPFYSELKAKIKESKVIYVDETTLNILEEKEKTKCYVFAYVSSLWDQEQIILYDFSTDRKTTKTKELLEGYKGAISCDGYAGYDFLKILVQRCFTHIRRKFTDCLKVLPKENIEESPAYVIVCLINQLYTFEQKFKTEGYTVYEIEKARNSKEYNSVLRELDEKIENLSDTKNAMLKTAVNYYQNIKRKNQLYSFQKNGYLEIDNNRAERTIKPFVVGRKNFLFCKTKNGADITSQMYSIVNTTKANGLRPEEYLKYVMENIGKMDIEQLMPWNEIIQQKFHI